MSKIALITGANRGLGLEATRQLARRGFRVFLAARDWNRGQEEIDKLGVISGGAIELLRLDVSDQESIAAAAHDFGGRSDHLDVLINNAGILLDEGASVRDVAPEIVLATFETNTLGPLRVAQAFLPYLEKSSEPRIINVSSGAGELTKQYEAWAPAYCISKTALNAVTRQLAAGLPNFAVNSVCPGWVRTDMGGPNAKRSLEQGADTIVWLAAEAAQRLTAKFLRDRKEIPW